MSTCPWKYCGESFGKPLRGKGRVTSKPVFLCPECRGELPRLTELTKAVKGS